MTSSIRIARTSEPVDIHPTAQVHPGAVLGPGCVVGPFAVVGPDVELGARCTIHAHAVVYGPTRMGDDNAVHPFAVVGGDPQDLRHRGEATWLEVGHRNTFREYVTVNRGTVHGGGVTRIGNDNLVMAYSHIAHDCRLGDGVVLANNATLAGHAVLDDGVVFGGFAAVASFVHVGTGAMLAAGSMAERDVPPFAMAGGNRAVLRGPNRVGMARRGIPARERAQVRFLLRKLKTTALPPREVAALLGDAACGAGAVLAAFLRRPDRAVVR